MRGSRWGIGGRRAGLAAAVTTAASLCLVVALVAEAQSPPAPQPYAAGFSISSAARPSLFTQARNSECEASPQEAACDSFTVTVRNEGRRATGTVAVGDTETCEPGTWDPASPPTEFKYEWLRNTTALPTKVGSAQAYTVQSTDKEYAITCRVTASNAYGSVVADSMPMRVAPLPTQGSAALAIPAMRESQGNFFSPRVSKPGGTLAGTAKAGDAVECHPGKWLAEGGALGGGEIKLAYRWLVAGVAETSFKEEQPAFQVPASAEGKTVQCEIRAAVSGPNEKFTGVFAASVGAMVVEPVPAGAPPKLNELAGFAETPLLKSLPAIDGVALAIEDAPPPGTTAVGIVGTLFQSKVGGGKEGSSLPCDLATLTCTVPAPVPMGWGARVTVAVTVQQPEGTLAPNFAEVSGGGLAAPRSTADEPPGTTAPVRAVPSAAEADAPQWAVETGAVQPFGHAGLPDLQAGDRPDTLTTGFQLPAVARGLGFKDANVSPEPGSVRDVRVTLPPGLVGDPLATERCPQTQIGQELCPPSAQVGAFNEVRSAGTPVAGNESQPLFNTVPQDGYPAEFGGLILSRFVGLYPSLVRAPADEGGYTVRVATTGVPTFEQITGVMATFFGNPALRIQDAGGAPNFLTNPAHCGVAPLARIEADSWADVGNYVSLEAPLLPAGQVLEGCSLLNFGPSISFEPETSQADSPSGYRFGLNVPQAQRTEPNLGTPPLKDATVTLPEGLVADPASADGLVGCTPTQIDLEGEAINGFDHGDDQSHPTPGNCPLASKIATAEVTTPLLEAPVRGSVYLGTPECSPCTSADAQSGKLLRLYIEARDKKTGIVVKLEGHVTADPSTDPSKGGQLSATFLNNPQFPFSKVALSFKGGPRAALSNPQSCGTHTVRSDLTPWSTPETPDATPAAQFSINSGPSGGPCAASEAAEPNAPSFEAGTTQPLAGSYAPFVMQLSRADGTQRLKGVNLTLPPGLTGKLAGLQTCSDAAIAAAGGRSGAAEKASPSCPAGSELGTVTVGAGAGSAPFHTSGHAYLAGPYKGAPLSFAVITPAVAGPFDLGTVVVRAPAYVDPRTARITVKSDELPHILAGVPLDVRSIAVKMDRSDFTRNPTSCEANSVSGQAISLTGSVAPLSSRFQVGGCSGLAFKPKIGLRLFGKTNRGAHPKLRAVVSARDGEANIARASVALPHSEFIDQAHFRTICTRVQFAAGQCPSGSVYGHVTATTPLLDEPLSGPVYLRSSSHKLPDVVAVLRGPASRPIEVELVGRVDSIHGGLRTTIEAAPDAPVSKFVLTMQGGAKSLFINSRNLCSSVNRATVKLDGQNGKAHDFRPVLKNDCGGKTARRERGRRRLP